MKQIERFNENPLITTSDIRPSRDDFEVIGVFNPAVVFHDGKYVMLIRVAERPLQEKGKITTAWINPSHPNTIETLSIDRSDPDLKMNDPRFFTYRGKFLLSSLSHLRLAVGSDGKSFRVSDKPFLFPQEQYECYGIEDPRITQTADNYTIAFCAVSEQGVCGCLAQTSDFDSVTRLGIIMPPDNKEIVLFPEKLQKGYTLFHRPCSKTFSSPSMWLACSQNLRDWGEHTLVLTPRTSGWDSARIGCGPQPVATPKGWLEIYHGADSSERYCAGAVLLDKSDPSKVIARSKNPFLYASMNYETEGFMPGVVFPTGLVEIDRNCYYLYYGAADDKICGSLLHRDILLREL